MPAATPTTPAGPPVSEYFCSNAHCMFHVRVGDPGVQGFGDWAQLDDGTVVSHRWVGERLLCDLCARRATRGRS